MAFWTESTAQPKRNYRFRVTITGLAGSSVIWWAKSFKPPSYEVSEQTHDYLDNKYYFPGRLTWGDCSMVLVDPVDPVNAVEATNNLIIKSGYVVKTENVAQKTISRQESHGALGAVVIEILDAAGDPIETWTLRNAFIKAATFSDLAYDNDELRTIDMTFRYDWAECVNKGSADQQFKKT